MNYNQQHMYELCKKHMHSYVLAEMNDGTQVDGIITGIDDEYVYMAIPIGQDNNMGSHHQHHRPFGFGGFGYGYPGYGYGFGGYPGYGRPRRFSRLVLPLAALTALSVLPWY
ncbi:hypothetical protein SAMN04488072_102125 [Lentibacillus halodurans]|uniref:Uncharacterized protein n=1 Tax=Lentibacillus halodurans TaxID=237679 RepID=A0A1I0W353_9BACI|nr:hypothetical protein [Lentibacillus halodurans]SFA82316.1 hypothetical protein SAMN04488072_102125 [Lentibacillus halodurans]